MIPDQRGNNVNNSRFTFNAFLIVILVFSIIGLFFTVKLHDLAKNVYLAYNYEEIEGTELGIKFSTHEPSGIYKGSENNGELVVEGDFGYDWGTTIVGDKLYLNEFGSTDVGMMLVDTVVVDTKSFGKQIIKKNAILRGRCKSGELVCVADEFLEVNAPDTNSLLRLFTLTSGGHVGKAVSGKEGKVDQHGSGGTILFIDPETSEVVYSTPDTGESGKAFSVKYFERTLEEVKG